MIAKGAGSWNEPAEPQGAAGSAPTALRIALGAQLRQLREVRGISREEAADAIRGSDAKISRMELGRVGLKDRDVRDLLALYGITTPTERDQFLALAKQGQHAGVVARVRRRDAPLVRDVRRARARRLRHPHL